ncbi:MAG: hypothetical protein ACRD1K_14415 [Acidimicrobiales bacterium]
MRLLPAPPGWSTTRREGPDPGRPSMSTTDDQSDDVGQPLRRRRYPLGRSGPIPTL